MTLPANHPQRATREQEVEAGFRCRNVDCQREWFIVAFEGEPPADHDVCPFCHSQGVRTR